MEVPKRHYDTCRQFVANLMAKRGKSLTGSSESVALNAKSATFCNSDEILGLDRSSSSAISFSSSEQTPCHSQPFCRFFHSRISWVLPIRPHRWCEKRKPKYTSRVPKSTLSLSHYARRKHLLWLRPRSYLLLCNVKIKELVPP